MAHISKEAVAIVEWNQMGHHETYLRHYTNAFLNSGHPVIVMCKDPAKLTNWIAKHTNTQPSQFIAVELPDFAWDKQRIRRKRRKQAFAWFKNKIFDIPKQRKIKQALRNGESALNVKCGWVHFACFYEHQAYTIKQLIDTFNLPWTSLYLLPNIFYACPNKTTKTSTQEDIAQKLLQDSRLRGLLLLNEHIAPAVEQYCNCPIIIAPDFADISLPTILINEDQKKQQQKHNPTIGLLGYLLPSKGTISISRLLLQNKLKGHALILAGELPWDKYDAEQQIILQNIQQCESARTRFEWINDESEYNALIQECDILLATYTDFAHSSNTLTKAAIFNKPVIVNDGHLMAQRVRDYRLGEIIPEGDLNALRDAILKITTNTEHWIQTNQPRWAAYRTRHSIESLSNSIQQLAE